MLRRTTAILTAALVLGAVAAPAALAKGPSRKGGKKPIGTVASFDGTTLTVTLNDGSSATATADEDTQVKVDHRGRPAAKGNPTRGSLDDLVAGTAVLRMKTEDGLLEKVRIRRTATDSAPAPATTCTDDAEEGETEEGDTEETEGDTEETEGETEGDTEEGDTEETEGETEGDTEEGETEGDTEETEETDTEEGDESDSDVSDACDEADDADDDADDVDEEDDAEEEEEEEEADPIEDVIEDLPLP